MAWLLDTNILSELRRPRPEPKVVDFIERKPLRELYISVVTIEGRVIQVQIDIVAETGFPRFMKKILEELKTFRDRIKDLRPRLLTSALDQKQAASQKAAQQVFDAMVPSGQFK